ncbi:unnamed protein product, partial [Rotaria magnacalcarata]
MKELSSAIILISCVSLVDGSSSSSSSSSNATADRPHFPVVQVTFEHVSNVFGICLWILLGILAKIGITE